MENIKKNPLSLQLNAEDFLPASNEEKQSLVVMRESVNFWKDGIRRLKKNKIAMVSFVFIIAIAIFVVVYGRMIEIYFTVSLAPIPMATMVNRGGGQMGHNYLRSLFALAFQAFLIIVCVAIYAVLIQSISVSEDISQAIWGCMGYTILLCFALFKTGSLSRSIFSAH